MKSFRFVKINPSGNTTGLILDETALKERSALAHQMMSPASLGVEQIAFADLPGPEPCDFSLSMMGGEFCGNAVRSAAAWMAFDRRRWQPGKDEGEPLSYSVTCSGADGIFLCRVKPIDKCRFYVSAPLPLPQTVRVEIIEGRHWGYVEFKGITHYICTEPVNETDRFCIVKNMIHKIGDRSQAAGILFWDRVNLDPWVYVAQTDTLCRETSCGSGSAAVGVWTARSSEKKKLEIPVHQKGGLIQVSYFCENRKEHISISGEVRIEAEGIVYLE
jgi:diaminopimelate epimerase